MHIKKYIGANFNEQNENLSSRSLTKFFSSILLFIISNFIYLFSNTISIFKIYTHACKNGFKKFPHQKKKKNQRYSILLYLFGYKFVCLMFPQLEINKRKSNLKIYLYSKFSCFLANVLLNYLRFEIYY